MYLFHIIGGDRWGWAMTKGFDSRTSEMQIQIIAGVNFYALLLKNATVFFVSLSLSLSICCCFFFFLFFLIAYYHFCGIKLRQVSSFMVIFSTQLLVNFIPAMFLF